MSDLGELVGQCLMFGIPSTTIDAQTEALLREERVGAVCLFRRNTPDSATTSSLTAALREIGPIHVGIDQEGGLVQRLPLSLPSAMACAAGGPEATALAALVCARELRAVGVTINLAPVLDVANEPDNPVIGLRSFGADPALVAACGRVVIETFQGQGLAATAKHFPGHGATRTDSHLGLPVIESSFEHLLAVELPPFQAAIDAGIDAIMVGHLAVPALDPSGGPAGLSPAVVTDLLRDRLGFQGVIISDCMEMAGAGSGDIGELAVRAMEAGVDLILVSHSVERQRRTAAALKAAVLERRISERRLRQSAERVAALRRASATDSPRSEENRRLLAEVARLSVTVVDNAWNRVGRLGVVSFRDEQRSQAEDVRQDREDVLIAQSRQLGADGVLCLPADLGSAGTMLEWAAPFDSLIVGTRNASHHPGQLEAVRRLTRMWPVAVIALREPYELAALPAARARIATCGDEPQQVEVALGTLLGDVTPVGRLAWLEVPKL